MAAKTTECSYTIFAGGDSAFLRAVAIPVVDALEKHLPPLGISKNKGDLDKSLAVSGDLRNDIVAITGLIGIFLFFSSRITGKIIDDIYTSKIQPKVKKILGKAEKKLKHANARKKKMYWFGVWYAEQRVLVLVAAVGDTYKEILNQNDVIATTHANANSWIEKNGHHKPIHLYLLEKGRTNVTPMLFNTLTEASSYIHKQFPHAMSKKLKRPI